MNVLPIIRAKNYLTSLGRADSPRIFVNSVPKSGTNLVVSLTLAYGRLKVSGPVITGNGTGKELRGRTGLIFGHIETMEGTAKELGLEAIYLLLREPRAYAISLARYIASNKRHPLHSFYVEEGSDRLFEAVVGGVSCAGFHLDPIAERYRKYIDNGRRTEARMVDFDRLLSSTPEGGAEVQLLTAIGGPDFRETLTETLARSKSLSSTFIHSQRSTLTQSLPDALADHLEFKTARELYENAFHR